MNNSKYKLIRTAAIACVLTVLSQSPVSAQRTIEQAADALLNEVLASLEIKVTNTELLTELSFEVQYALDAGIVDAETIKDLDIEVLNEELPDEELFEEEDIKTSTSSSSTTVASDNTVQLSQELRTQLRNRLTLRLTTQLRYWEVVAGDWSKAAQLAKVEFDKCLSTATTDEASDVCYFNEQQQLHFFYAQQLAESFTLRLNAANQLGTDVVDLLNQSMTRSRVMVQEALQYMNTEELGTLGLNSETLEDISRKLGNPPTTTPAPGPSNSNPSNGQNQ